MEVISQEFKAIVQIVESISIDNSRKDLEIAKKKLEISDRDLEIGRKNKVLADWMEFLKKTEDRNGLIQITPFSNFNWRVRLFAKSTEVADFFKAGVRLLISKTGSISNSTNWKLDFFKRKIS